MNIQNIAERINPEAKKGEAKKSKLKKNQNLGTNIKMVNAMLPVSQVTGTALCQVEGKNQSMLCQAQRRLCSLCGSNDDNAFITFSQCLLLSCMEGIPCNFTAPYADSNPSQRHCQDVKSYFFLNT